MDKRSDTFTLDGTCSTQEAARSVGVSYVSLRRWLGTRGSGPFHKWLRAHDRLNTGLFVSGRKTVGLAWCCHRRTPQPAVERIERADLRDVRQVRQNVTTIDAL